MDSPEPLPIPAKPAEPPPWPSPAELRHLLDDARPSTALRLLEANPSEPAPAHLGFYKAQALVDLDRLQEAYDILGALLPHLSGEVYADVPATEKPTAGDLGAEAMSGDVQYLLVLDRYGNWIDTLLWRRANEYYWRPFTFNRNR